ncbi:MAG: hypothetical protein ACRCZO_04625, partial [Cetobacterium sp.]
LKPTTPNMRGGTILNKTKPVAILLEPFFLDSVKSIEELWDLLEKTADSIVEILEYLEKNEL